MTDILDRLRAGAAGADFKETALAEAANEIAELREQLRIERAGKLPENLRPIAEEIFWIDQRQIRLIVGEDDNRIGAKVTDAKTFQVLFEFWKIRAP